MVAALALAGLVGTVAACTGGGTGAGTGQAARRAATASGPVAVSPPPMAWEQCPLPESGAATEVRAVAAGGGGVGWTAVGQRGTGVDTRPAVWTASDGCRWRRSAVVPVTSDGVHTAFQAVVRRGRLVVALGGAVGQTHGNVRPTLWRSVGGSPLREVQLPRELFGGPRGIAVTGLAAGPTAIFAFGGYASVTGRPAVQVWRTVDGADWRPLPPSPLLIGDRREQPQAAALVTAGSAVGVPAVGVPAGGVLAGAELELHDGLRDGFDAAAWYSPDPDLRTWQRADLSGIGVTGPGDQQLVAAAQLAGRYVAVAEVAAGTDRRLRALDSPDGRRWTPGGTLPVQAPPSSSSPPSSTDAVALTLTLTPAAAGGLLAAGLIAGQAALWQSVDAGRTWTAEPMPGHLGAIHGITVAADPASLVLVQQTPTGPRLYRTRRAG